MYRNNQTGGEIRVTSVLKLRNNLIVSFRCTEQLKKYFTFFEMHIHYDDIVVDNIPYSIAVIPFLTNILPLVWFTGSTVEVEDVDGDLLESIINVKRGMQQMYPSLHYPKGEETGIVYHRIVRNTPTGDKSITLFTGGADAFATLLSHIDEKPTIVIVRGTEQVHKIESVWSNVKNLVDATSKEFNLNRVIATSNLRWMFNLRLLDSFLVDKTESYWYSYQHGLALTGLLAPLSYAIGCKNVYISASFSKKDKGIITCGSDPSIEGCLQYMGINVQHDQYDKNRQQKLKLISDYQKSKGVSINMRVCYSNISGTNCCSCEKCSRTIVGLLAENANPECFGFKSDSETLARIKDNIQNKWTMNDHTKVFWKEVQSRYISNVKVKHSLPEMNGYIPIILMR